MSAEGKVKTHIPILILSCLLLLSNLSLAQADSLRNLLQGQTGEELVTTLLALLSESDLSFDERLQYADQALDEAEKLNDSLIIADALNERAFLQYNHRMYDACIEGFEKSLGIALRHSYKDLQSEIYYRLGFAFHKKNRNIEGTACLRNAIHLNKELEKQEEYGDALNGLGYYYWSISQFDSALYYYEKGLEVRTELQDSVRMGKSYNNIGIIYWYWSIYDKALEYYRQALEMRRAIGDMRGVVLVLNNIGLLYKEWHYYEMSKDYLLEAMEESERLNDFVVRGYVKNNLGELYVEIDKPDSAMLYFQQSLDEYLQTNDLRNLVLIYCNIGNVWLQLGNIDTAKAVLKEAIAISDTTDNFRMKAVALRYLGEAENMLGNFSKAIEYLNEAVELDMKISAKEDLRDTYIILADVYERKGNYREALRIHRLYTTAKDSIDADEVNKRILEFKMRYQIEKNERLLQAKQYEVERQTALTNILFFASIALIIIIIIIFIINRSRLTANRKLSSINQQVSEQNEKINSQKAQLEIQQERLRDINKKLEATNKELNVLNSTKDKFFSIVSHDLKNPFQALLGYAELLDEDYDELDDKEKKDIIANLMEVSQSSFRLVDNLLNWSRAQLGKLHLNPEILNLHTVTNEVAEILEGSFISKKIQFYNRTDRNKSIYADKNAVKLVLRNLLTNAIKFTPRHGTISVDCRESNGFCTIGVQDTGVGMEKNDTEKLFKIDEQISKEGTQQEKGTGLGLILCKEFVEHSGGKIWVESLPLQGSTFFFTLPVSQE